MLLWENMAKAFNHALEQSDDSAGLKKEIDELGRRPENVIEIKYKAGRNIDGKSGNDDFEKVFEDISEDGGYKKWRKEAGTRPEVETATQDVRKSMIEDLVSGMDISDVIEKYSK